jgi:hypothetical protein
MLRFGLALIALSFLPWLAIPIVPWMSFLESVTQKSAAVAGLIILAEVLFWIGLVSAGPETWKIIKLHGWRAAPKKFIEIMKKGS